jgi:hypothetical protein
VAHIITIVLQFSAASGAVERSQTKSHIKELTYYKGNLKEERRKIVVLIVPEYSEIKRRCKDLRSKGKYERLKKYSARYHQITSAETEPCGT